MSFLAVEIGEANEQLDPGARVSGLMDACAGRGLAYPILYKCDSYSKGDLVHNLISYGNICSDGYVGCYLSKS